MDSATRKRLCDTYDLGEPRGDIAPVSGGFQHRMWRLETARGVWAVKQLSEPAQTGDGRAQIERTEQIAHLAQARGFPAVAALLGVEGENADRVQEVEEGVVVAVYPWVDGATLPPIPASPEQAAQIGALLARLHGFDLPGDGLPPPTPDHFAPDHWRDFSVRGRASNVAWADDLADGLSDVLAANEAARIASVALASGHTVGHRDLDQKNVLWRADTNEPLALDWEQAGLTHPAQEAMGCALNWAGVSAGPPDPRVFAAFLQGYARVAPLRPADLQHADGSVLGKWLVWLELNLRHSLDPARPENDRVGAAHRARHALGVLRGLWRDAPVRRAWIEGVL